MNLMMWISMKKSERFRKILKSLFFSDEKWAAFVFLSYNNIPSFFQEFTLIHVYFGISIATIFLIIIITFFIKEP
jgi:hypothetical protein